MSTGAVTTLEQAERCKERGNACFKKEKFSAAIEAYTEAITLCPDIPVYWTNRAICHRKKNDWERVASDCGRALELDKYSVKAHYYLGLARVESEDYDEAVKQLERAYELTRGGRPTYIVEDIWHDLCNAKYLRWRKAANKQAENQKALRKFCELLIKRELDHTSEQHASRDSEDHIDSSGTEIKEKTGMDWLDVNKEGKSVREKEYEGYLNTLSDVFERAAALDKPGEVPDYLCCQITMEPFRDPVITPSGITYERATLLEHLSKLGRFDPLTREVLHPDQIVPNLAIKEAVQAYLDEHGWAYKT